MIKPEQKTAILSAAKDVNFYGKRLRDSRLECAEEIAAHIGLKIEPADLVAWLDANKPAQPEKEKRQKADNKPAANTIQQGHTERPDLPLIAGEFDAVIITAVQNNTAPNVAAWQALKDFAADVNAHLICAPVYYNKNAFSATVEDENERFDPAFAPYMIDTDTAIFGNGLVHLYASAAVPATAKQPVNAAGTLNNGELVSIVPALRQQLKTLVRSQSMPIREAWATGTATAINYTRSRAGSEAAADHCFGGLLVIRDQLNGRIYCRNLVYKNGVILDADTVAPDQAVAVLGDLHSEVKDPENWHNTLGWLERLRPAEIVVHDILHFSTRSHHQIHKGDHLYRTRDQRVQDDLLEVITDLNRLAEIAPVYIVESNHNSALDLWISDMGYNPKKDPQQAKFYYLLNWLVCDAIDNGDDCQLALKVAFDNLSAFGEFPELSDLVTFGQMHKSELRYGYDISQHGHKGANGAVGGVGQFSKWAFPMIVGHSHSPAIQGKTLVVGVTARLDQGYNRGGGSSWNQSHGLILPNGTAQIYPMRGLYL